MMSSSAPTARPRVGALTAAYAPAGVTAGWLDDSQLLLERARGRAPAWLSVGRARCWRGWRCRTRSTRCSARRALAGGAGRDVLGCDGD